MVRVLVPVHIVRGAAGAKGEAGDRARARTHADSTMNSEGRMMTTTVDGSAHTSIILVYPPDFGVGEAGNRQNAADTPPTQIFRRRAIAELQRRKR